MPDLLQLPLNLAAPDDEIDTARAARLLNVSQRRIEQLCSEGVLAEGRDWWRVNGRGFYHLKRRAVLGLKEKESE